MAQNNSNLNIHHHAAEFPAHESCFPVASSAQEDVFFFKNFFYLEVVKMAAPSFTCVKIRSKDESYQLFVDNKTLECIKQDPTKYLNDIKASGFCSTLGKPFNLDPLTDQVFIEIGDTLPTASNGEGTPDVKAMSEKVTETTIAPLLAHTSNGVGQHNSVKKAPGQQMSWDREPTYYLIELRNTFRSLFARPPCTKAKLWQQISDKMAEKGYKISREDCDTKWRNLISTYKKNKEKVEKDGNVSVAWEFFKPMDEILGENFSLPTPSHLSSSQTPVPEPSRCPKKTKKRKKHLAQEHGFAALPSQLLDEESSSSGGEASTPRSTSPEVHFPECVIPHSDSSTFHLAQLRKRKPRSDRAPPAWFVKYMQKHEEEERTFRNECIELERERLQVEKNKLGELRNRLSIEQQRVKELSGVKQLLTKLLEKLG